ncbi:YhgE/Pip domain-containing protein [Brevibacterium litoralis]|uniref:YhgE/Pip domain-containing protein n=1 Tax=Brevibacterium litoralis TaxID=3138935 RepID=UPI0032EED9B0
MALFERADTGRTVTWWSVLGLILVPVIIGAGFVLAVWNTNDRLDTVQAAIVNNDEGTEVDGQTVPMGRQLSAGLVDSEIETNIDWVLSDDEDAAEGLADGRYVTVLTIPEDFSENVMSTSEAMSATGEEDPAEAVHAKLEVTSSKTSPIADSLVGQMIAQTARTAFNEEFASMVFDNVLVGFNDIGEQFDTIAEGVSDLDDGANDLSDGADLLDEGFGEFVIGLDTLDESSTDLSDGARELANGVGTLSTSINGEPADGSTNMEDGARQLADGVSTLSDSIDGEPADGSTNMVDGAQQLADGAAQLDTAVSGEPADGSPNLVTGAEDLADGAAEYTTGVDTLVCTLGGANVTDPELVEYCGQLTAGADAGSGEGSGSGSGDAAGLGDLVDGVSQLDQGATGLDDGLTTYQETLRTNADQTAAAGAVTLSEEQRAAIAAQMCADLPAEVGGPEGPMCDGLVDAYAAGMGQGVATGLDQAADGLDQQDPATGLSLMDVSGQVADGASQLDEGLSDFGTDALLPQDQAEQLLGGGAGLRTGTEQFSDGVGDLAEGIGGLSEGASGLADGVVLLGDGVGELETGASGLADGVTQLGEGVDDLETGATGLADGIDLYTDGVGTLAENGGDLSDGVGDLADGTGQLADGTGELSDGLDEGKDEIPSYDEGERENLSAVMTSAIGGDDGEGLLDGVNTASTVALLLAMALWIGALATYTVIRAVPAAALVSRKSSWRLTLRGLVPGVFVGVVQALVLVAISLLVLDPTFTDTIALFFFAVLAAVAFTALNFALVAWFGGVGRFVSVVLVVFGIAGAVLGSVPAAYHAVAPFMPVTPFMKGVTALATGVGGIGSWVTILLVWTLVSVAAGVVAVARKRTVGAGTLVGTQGAAVA